MLLKLLHVVEAAAYMIMVQMRHHMAHMVNLQGDSTNPQSELMLGFHLGFGLLQNPGISLAWSIANYVLQGQIMGFKVDTWPHCLGPTSNPPLIAITLVIVIFAHVFVAAGFLFTHRPLSLYRFPTKFRNESCCILLGAAAFFVMARALKQVVQRKQQARHHQALQRRSGGSRLSGTGGSLGSADVTTLQANSLRELSTKFRWLTLRAPKIAPLSHGLSGQATARRNTFASSLSIEVNFESRAKKGDEKV